MTDRRRLVALLVTACGVLSEPVGRPAVVASVMPSVEITASAAPSTPVAPALPLSRHSMNLSPPRPSFSGALTFVCRLG
jgi:hypothetical protein